MNKLQRDPKGKFWKVRKNPSGYKWNPKAVKVKTAEEWYRKAVDAFKRTFKDLGYEIPVYDISSGFTDAGTRVTRVLGQCWTNNASSKGRPHIFLNPRYTEPVGLIAVVLHEVIHATVGVDQGHRGKFRSVAQSLGFIPPLKYINIDDDLKGKCETIAARLGEFPRSAFVAKIRKQTTRLIKCVCETCGFTFRTTKFWIEQSGNDLRCPDESCKGTIRNQLG